MQIAKISQKVSRYSFKRGWMRVTLGEKEAVKKELLEVFGSYSRPFWTAILYGRKPLTVDQMEAVEAVFAKYGIRKSNIWGS
jgi:hypothetical protein